MRESFCLVLGAGVSGLTSALRLLEAGYRVTILAAARTPHTTSDIAAAVWYPFHAGPRERALVWAAESYREFKGLAEADLADRDEADQAGVTMVSGIELWPADLSAGDSAPWWQAAITGGARLALSEERPAGYEDGHGYVFEAPVIAMPRYLGWLERQVSARGGEFVQGRLTDLDAAFGVDLGDRRPSLVVNCTGLAARELTGDGSLFPIRGQIVRVAPGYAHRFIQATADETRLAYIIPRPDCTVLGGTAEEGEWDTTVRPETASAILARCIALEPRLAEAPVLSHAAGLRPGRPEVRLEAERRGAGVVIHNYGHGGAGVTLSWGCAAEVVRLVETQPS